MSDITLQNPVRIGKVSYTTFNTANVTPRVILKLFLKLPNNESKAGLLLLNALEKGLYKRQPGSAYFAPSIIIDGEEIFQIDLAKSSIEELFEIFEELTNTPDKYGYQKRQIKREIEKRNNKDELERIRKEKKIREFYKTDSGQHLLPFKKRKNNLFI